GKFPESNNVQELKDNIFNRKQSYVHNLFYLTAYSLAKSTQKFYNEPAKLTILRNSMHCILNSILRKII
ncbi:hypothetical protein V1478_010739, partial [Vespula squamosa]